MQKTFQKSYQKKLKAQKLAENHPKQKHHSVSGDNIVLPTATRDFTWYI